MRKFWPISIALVALTIGVIFAASNTNSKKDAKDAKKTVSEKKHQENSEKGIKFFQGSWKAAKEKARETGKPIFVDAYAEWCGPCKMMDKRVFTRSSVGNFYNENFINYQYDMEKGKGPKFSKKYRVTAYPTLIYFDSEGEVVHRKRGAIGPKGLIKLGEQALNKVEKN